MKVLISTILFAILAGCYGYSYIIPASLKFPGICFYNGHMLPQGDSQMPGVCQNTKCNPEGSITVDGCGRITLPNCTLVEDPNLLKSYPDCCAMTYQCIDAEGATYTKEWNQLYPSGKTMISKVIDIKEAITQQKQGDSKVVSPFILQFLLEPIRVRLSRPYFRWVNGSLIDNHNYEF